MTWNNGYRGGVALLVLVLAGLIWPAWARGETKLFVAPDGSDQWSGKLAAPNAEKTDGPLATPLGARDAIRRLRGAGEKGPVTVLFRGGTYWMGEPWVFEPQDSGSAEGPVVYAAMEGERPVLSGGRRITGWKPGPHGVWTAPVPEAASGSWVFQQLWVDGRRATRARSPNEGFFRMARKAPPGKDDAGNTVSRDRTAFVFNPGDMKRWPDYAHANVVVFHSWETSRLRIATVDESECLVTFTGPSNWPFESWEAKQRYYVENVLEAMDAPGEWYLNAAAGKVMYIPRQGEEMANAEVIAPRLDKLVVFRGDPDAGQLVQYVTLRNLTLAYEDWALEPEGHSDPQAVVTAPAAVIGDGVRHCAIEQCEIVHVGDYGVWLRRGSKHCRVVQNRIHDLGAGGVRIGEAGMPPTDETESSENLVDNNHIYDGGHVYPAGVGIWVAQSSHNTISHNEIHDFFYSGMSIGWDWNDQPNRCHHNTIEWNHVHHVMQGMLSDGGAIYTLGASPGSVIRNNVFHDVWPYDNPPLGWGIYLDATTSGYLVENNVVYNILSGGLMYSNGGHENVIRNNIFAFSANYMLWPFWERRPNSFQHNIIYMTQGELFVPFTERSLKERLAAGESLGPWDENLYWHTGQLEELSFYRRRFAEWQELGLDGRSRIADPRFVNPGEYDFRLRPDSPARELGFQPIDTSGVGLYGDPAWVEEARRVKHPRTVLPPPPPPPAPLEVSDHFEACNPGDPPQHATLSGQEHGAAIAVTDEQAASGHHCLKVTDAAQLQPAWQPHFFYQPHITTGTVRQAFDLKLSPGAAFFTEWRDETPYPECIGPSVAFDGSGHVTAAGKLLTTIPVTRWVHVEIEAQLGKEAPRQFTLAITPPGGPQQRFQLPLSGRAFSELHWLGFVSTAADNVVFYLDNIVVKRQQ